MNRLLTFSKFVKNIGIEYDNGSCSPTWPDWRYENIQPKYNKFYYFLEGECYLKINNSEYIAKKGQLFLLPYNSVQTYYNVSDNLVTMNWFHFNADCNGKDLMELITLSHYIQVKENDYVEGLFNKIFEYGKNSNLISQMRQQALVLELLAYYMEKCDVTSNKIEFMDANIGVVLAFIEDNLHRNISIDELSELLHFHPNYFIRYFKDIMKVSPIEYTNNLRIEKAKTLLSTESITIEEIAHKVGFSTLYYFSRTFKEKTGFTPTDYRLLTSNIEIK